jgi:hypothetical protein
MKTSKITLALTTVIAIVIVLTCGRNPIAGNGTQTGNPVIAMLYNPDGSPAVNAKVCFYHRDNDPRPDSGEGVIDSALTDTNGNYTVTLAAGTYTIVANGDSGLAYKDSVAVTGGDTIRPAPDTLRPAGSVRGVVRLEEGGDPRTIFVLFMGTRTFTWPDDSLGNFTSGLMAEGRYRVRLITTTPDYLPLDDTLEVTAGREDTLADTIILKYNGIPVPKNLRIQYDTMKQIVTLTWNRPVSSRPLLGYNIYRKHQDSALVLLRADWPDTTYNDSTGIQDITYEYRVAAVDMNTIEGTRSAAVSVTVVSALILTDSVVSPMINSSQAHGFIIGKDTTIYIAVAGLSNFIRVLSKTGDSINAIGEGVIGQVYDMALDSKENLFAVDPDNNMVFKFLKNGQFVSSWPINMPTAIAIDSLDNIYVVFSNRLGILKLDTAGQHVDSTTLGTGTYGVHFAVAPDGRIFVGCLSTDSITVYDANLSATGSFQLVAENHPITELQAIDKNGNLYMRYVRSVQPDLEFRVFSSSGSYVATLQPQRGGDFARVFGSRLYLMSQMGLSVYSIPF